MTDSTTEKAGSNDVAAVQKPGQACRRMVDELRRHIVGMEEAIDQVVIAIFSRGHGLLEGVLGLDASNQAAHVLQ